MRKREKQKNSPIMEDDIVTPNFDWDTQLQAILKGIPLFFFFFFIKCILNCSDLGNFSEFNLNIY